jgi:tRNA(Ile)-lysidine synthase
LAKELGMSEEEAGRKVRYDIFSETAAAEGCTKIAVAHHKNDLAETLLFNLVRGSGLSGLTGISSTRENIIRPLLCVSRQEIEEYLRDIGQDYRTDSTNAALDYTRNKIRHTVIPALEEINSEAVEHIVSLAMDAENADSYIEKKAEEVFDAAKLKVCMGGNANNRIYLNIPVLQQADDVILYKLVHNCLIRAAGRKKDIIRRHIESVAALVSNDTGKSVVLPYGMTARRSYDKLIIECEKTGKKLNEQANSIPGFDVDLKAVSEKNESSEAYVFEPDSVPDLLKCSQENKPRLEFSLMNAADEPENFMKKNVYTKIFSYDKILAKNATRFCIRTRHEGDYIVIAPDGSTKKLNRVFIDAKTDRKDRECWPLVALDDEILWAVGLRYNEAYRVTEDTKVILTVRYIM